MADVEYCDNISCIRNRKYTCSAAEVDFDETGNCLTARYNDGGEAASSTPHEPPGSEEDSGQSGDAWLKYI